MSTENQSATLFRTGDQSLNWVTRRGKEKQPFTYAEKIGKTQPHKTKEWNDAG